MTLLSTQTVEALARGRQIQKERSLAQRTKTCPSCGKVFVQPITMNWHARRKPFCSDKCRFDWSDKRARELFQQGQPLITIEYEYVECNICGKRMTQASTHFAREHGLRTKKGLTHLDRQYLYGLPMGSRLACGRLMEFYKASGDPTSFTRIRKANEGRSDIGSRIGVTRAMVRPSPAQQEAMQRTLPANAFASHVKACRRETISTSSIREEEKRRFCSVSCASRASVPIRTEAANSPEARAKQIAALKAVRAAKYWSSRAGEEWHKQIECAGCGKTITVTASSPRKYCSSACYHWNRPETLVPPDEAIVAAVRQLRAHGRKYADIASELGITFHQVHRIIRSAPKQDGALRVVTA